MHTPQRHAIPRPAVPQVGHHGDQWTWPCPSSLSADTTQDAGMQFETLWMPPGSCSQRRSSEFQHRGVAPSVGLRAPACALWYVSIRWCKSGRASLRLAPVTATHSPIPPTASGYDPTGAVAVVDTLGLSPSPIVCLYGGRQAPSSSRLADHLIMHEPTDWNPFQDWPIPPLSGVGSSPAATSCKAVHPHPRNQDWTKDRPGGPPPTLSIFHNHSTLGGGFNCGNVAKG